MKKRKAVVLYGSLTGNTEMVGKAMAEVLEEYGFETRCEKIELMDLTPKPIGTIEWE